MGQSGSVFQVSLLLSLFLSVGNCPGNNLAVVLTGGEALSSLFIPWNVQRLSAFPLHLQVLLLSPFNIIKTKMHVTVWGNPALVVMSVCLRWLFWTGCLPYLGQWLRSAHTHLICLVAI